GGEERWREVAGASCTPTRRRRDGAPPSRTVLRGAGATRARSRQDAPDTSRRRRSPIRPPVPLPNPKPETRSARSRSRTPPRSIIQTAALGLRAELVDAFPAGLAGRGAGLAGVADVELDDRVDFPETHAARLAAYERGAVGVHVVLVVVEERADEQDLALGFFDVAQVFDRPRRVVLSSLGDHFDDDAIAFLVAEVRDQGDVEVDLVGLRQLAVDGFLAAEMGSRRRAAPVMREEAGEAHGNAFAERLVSDADGIEQAPLLSGEAFTVHEPRRSRLERRHVRHRDGSRRIESDHRPVRIHRAPLPLVENPVRSSVVRTAVHGTTVEIVGAHPRR